MTNQNALGQAPLEKIFWDYAPQALSSMAAQDFMPVYFPLLAEGLIHAPRTDFAIAWKREYVTPSVRATGETRRGSKVVVYAHMPSSINDVDSLASCIRPQTAGDAQASPMRVDREAFQKLVDLDGFTDRSSNKLVWVIPFDTAQGHPNNSPSTIVKYHPDLYMNGNALEHPEAAGLFAGQERSYRFLESVRQLEQNLNIFYFNDFNADHTTFRLLNTSPGKHDYFVCTNYTVNWPLHFVALHKSLGELTLGEIIRRFPWFLESAEQAYNEEEQRKLEANLRGIRTISISE